MNDVIFLDFCHIRLADRVKESAITSLNKGRPPLPWPIFAYTAHLLRLLHAHRPHHGTDQRSLHFHCRERAVAYSIYVRVT